MNAEGIFEAMGELDLRYVEEALRFRGNAARRVWLKLAVCAACLAIVAQGIFFVWRWQEVVRSSEIVSNFRPLADVQLTLSTGVKVRYTDKVPAERVDHCLVYFTEEELFTHFDTAIFSGTVREIRNIELRFNGDKAYRAIAEIDVEKVYRGSCQAGETVSVMLPCPIAPDVWVEDTGVVSQMREGMSGIFMPVIYNEENSRWEQNGAVLIKKELVDYGFADGVRYAFLETEDGLVFDRGAYESIADARTMDEIEEYILSMIG